MDSADRFQSVGSDNLQYLVHKYDRSSPKLVKHELIWEVHAIWPNATPTRPNERKISIIKGQLLPSVPSNFSCQNFPMFESLRHPLAPPHSCSNTDMGSLYVGLLRPGSSYRLSKV